MRQNIGFRFGGPITETVKKLMIINLAVFLLQTIVAMFSSKGILENIFGLNHIGLIYEFRIWQLFTYMFLHGSFFHILFNLIGLWMFAGELEQRWGKKIFLQYYLFCGTGAGLCIALMNFIIFENYAVSPVTIGASGAIYGILLAYGMTWPNREVLLYFVLPVKIKYLVLVFGIIEFFGSVSSAMGTGSNISHIGHFGGLISGIIFITLKKGQKIPHMQNAGKENFIYRFFRKKRLERKKETIDNRIMAKKIIDDILEKIAREGMSSLSLKEKKELEWARRHYYPDDEDILH